GFVKAAPPDARCVVLLHRAPPSRRGAIVEATVGVKEAAAPYPPPCGEGRPRERSERGRGGGGSNKGELLNHPHPGALRAPTLPSRSRMFPTSVTLKMPNSGKPEFGGEGKGRLGGGLALRVGAWGRLPTFPP